MPRRRSPPPGAADRSSRGLPRARHVDGGSGESSSDESPRRDRHETPLRPTIRLSLGLDGTGAGKRATGVGFLDHMLDLRRPSRPPGPRRERQRRSRRRAPTTRVEDTGLVLGQALDEALGDRSGITRYGHAVVPMDEARAMCAIDVSGRPLLVVRRVAAAGRDRRASSTSWSRSSSALLPARPSSRCTSRFSAARTPTT